MGGCFSRTDGSIDGSSQATSDLKTDEGERQTSGNFSTSRTEQEILASPNLKAFTYNDLSTATRKFSPQCLIGEGGFGNVYKGWIDEQTQRPVEPESGTVIAVKKLILEGYQGHKEWLAEIDYLSQLHHRNLVKLVGFCIEGFNRLLVYEYMPNGSLEKHLFTRRGFDLSWERRIKVATDAARGLAFLHSPEQPVIFRDFKTANILLDSEYNAKLSDFGYAKAGPTGDQSHVSTRVLGTHGYAAPEYLQTGHLTTKCDVYSFGVVLFELLTGRHAIETTRMGADRNLVSWVQPYLRNMNGVSAIMDAKLRDRYPKKTAYTVALLAARCVSDIPQDRPEIVEVLKDLEELPPEDSSTQSSPRSNAQQKPPRSNLSDQKFPLPKSYASSSSVTMSPRTTPPKPPLMNNPAVKSPRGQ